MCFPNINWDWCCFCLATGATYTYTAPTFQSSTTLLEHKSKSIMQTHVLFNLPGHKILRDATQPANK